VNGTTTASNGKAHTTTPRWTRSALEVVPTSQWVLTLERPFPLVGAAVQSLQRDQIRFLSVGQESDPVIGGKDRIGLLSHGTITAWAQELAHEIEHAHCVGVIALTTDPGLVCCVANKTASVRAVAISTLAQAHRALLSLQPNFVALEMPGRTYFEIRQVLRLFAQTQPETAPIAKRGCECASAK